MGICVVMNLDDCPELWGHPWCECQASDIWDSLHPKRGQYQWRRPLLRWVAEHTKLKPVPLQEQQVLYIILGFEGSRIALGAADAIFLEAKIASMESSIAETQLGGPCCLGRMRCNKKESAWIGCINGRLVDVAHPLHCQIRLQFLSDSVFLRSTSAWQSLLQACNSLHVGGSPRARLRPTLQEIEKQLGVLQPSNPFPVEGITTFSLDERHNHPPRDICWCFSLMLISTCTSVVPGPRIWRPPSRNSTRESLFWTALLALHHLPPPRWWLKKPL